MSIARSVLPKTFSMKNGSELVWSMWEWLSRIGRPPPGRSIDKACESEPASSAIVPLTRRQVIRQSRLSPPYPPRTWISICKKDCIPPGGSGEEQEGPRTDTDEHGPSRTGKRKLRSDLVAVPVRPCQSVVVRG